MFDVSRSARGARFTEGVAKSVVGAVRSRWVVGLAALLVGAAPGLAGAATYYVNALPAVNVGLDGTTNMTGLADLGVNGGTTNQYRAITNNTAPSGTTRYRISEGANDTRTGQEFFRAYTPAYTVATNIGAAATAYADFYMQGTGTSVTAKATLYEYNDGTGIVGAAKGTASFTGDATINTRQTMNDASFGNATFTVASGNRLLVIYSFDMNNSRPAYLWGQAASAAPSGYQSFTVVESTGTTTLADGTNPANTPQLCPGGSALLDAFTLQTNSGTDAISQVTVGLSATAGAKLSLVEIRNDGDTAGYGSVAPASDTPAITTTGLSATTTLTQYKVKITAKPYASLAAGSYPVTGTASITGHSAAYALVGTDTASATVTIDRQAPGTATWGANAAGYGQVSLAWTNPATDFGAVLILRNTAAVADAPTDGATYTVGGTIGTSTIVYYGTGTSFADAGVTAGTSYYYAIFARDACTNFSAGVGAGPYVPLSPVLALTAGTVTAVANSSTQITVTAPFTGDVGGTPNSSTTFARGTSSIGPFTNVTGCVGLTGASPRICVDGAGLAALTTYYYQVTFTDPDGVNGVNPQVVSATTPRPSYTLTVGGTAATATTPAPGASSVIVGRITLQTTLGAGPVRVTGLKLQNTGTAVAGSDVFAVQVWEDNGTVGTLDGADVLKGTTTWDGSRWSLQGLAYDIGTTTTNLLVTTAVSTGATNGRTFLTSLAAADVTVVAPDVVAGGYASATGATVTTTGVVQEGDTTSGSLKPLVTILNPSNGGTVTGTFRLQLKVWDPTAITNVTNIQVSYDNGSTWPLVISPTLQKSPNTANYDADTTHAAVYDLQVAGLAAGTRSLKARASNDSGATYVMSGTVVVKAVGTPGGSGMLLVRDDSSQLCTDCHGAVKTHSSQNTSRFYGQWSTNCADCHTPHSTTNIGLVRTQITPPQVTTVAQPTKAVKISTRVGDSGSSAVASASFTNSDNSGPCQVCHTRTQNQSTLAVRWRNSGNADTHFDAASGTATCTGCHPHNAGFKGVESTGGAVNATLYGQCSTCHSSTFATMSAASGSRHAIGNVVGTNDYYVDSGVTWGNPLANVTAAQRSCVNMCHQDHVHNPVGGTSHSFSVFTDATTTANRAVTRDASGNITGGNPAAADFNAAATNGGLCLSCHQNPVESGTTPARPAIAKATYAASAHSFNATTTPAFTWRFTLHDGSTYVRSCTKCHASRTEGTTPTKGGSLTAVHGTQDPLLLAGVTSLNAAVSPFVCWNCHATAAAPAAGAQGDRSGVDLQAPFKKAYTHPAATTDQLHVSATEAAAAFNAGQYSGANRHVACLDCHDPHAAANTNHATGTNAVTATSPLAGVSGVGFTSPATNWATTSTANFTWKNGIATSVAAEYELCLKCHSSFAYGSTPPNGTQGASSTAAETDQSQEFSTSNQSYHPVAGALPATDPGANGSSRLTAAQLCSSSLGNCAVANGYPAGTQFWTPGQTMYCSDCHGNDSASATAQGPHGSSVKFVLKGPNTCWPYTYDGTACTTTLQRLQPPGATTQPTSNAFLVGNFCRNCHPLRDNSATNSTAAWANNNVHFEHSGSQLNNVACVQCHILVPHGGKVSRLIATATAGLPARYQVAAQAPTVNQYMKSATPNGYSSANCATSCGGHGSVATPETW